RWALRWILGDSKYSGSGRASSRSGWCGVGPQGGDCVRRVLIILAGVLVLALSLGLPASAATGTGSARTATLADCLASAHVCVSSDARSLVSQSRQSQLERQIGKDDIYLVVAPSGSSGYDPAMRQLISTLGAKHDQFAVGFLRSEEHTSELQSLAYLV